MGEPASESAQQFIELVRSKITAEEFGDFLVDLRNLHKYSSAGDLETAERFLDGIADFFTTDEEYMHLMSQFGAFVPVELRGAYDKRVAQHIERCKDTDGPHVPRPPTERPGAPAPDHEVTQALGSSLGRQARAGKRSEARVDFGREPRMARPMQHFRDFAPPGYASSGGGGGGAAAAPAWRESGVRSRGGAAGAYVGNNADMPGQRGSEWTPGPQRADVADGVHAACKRSSAIRTIPQTRFGKEEQRTDVVYISKRHSQANSIDGKYIPGPIYEVKPAVGAQALSTKRSEPQLTFELAPPTRRCVPIRQQRKRRPDGARALRSTPLLRGMLRSSAALAEPEPELPTPDDPEMTVDVDAAHRHCHPQPPSVGFARASRSTMIGLGSEREKLPASAPQRALMKGTMSPGPRYDVGGIVASRHRRAGAGAMPFGASQSLRHSYLPLDTQGRRAGGVADINERVARVRASMTGTTATMPLPSSLGAQRSSRQTTAPRFSVSRSRRTHHADRGAWCAETVSHNRRGTSDVARKYSRK